MIWIDEVNKITRVILFNINFCWKKISLREADDISAVVAEVKIFNYDVWNMQPACFAADDQISLCKRNLSLAYQNDHLWF